MAKLPLKSEKDSSGAYVKELPKTEEPVPSVTPGTLDDILNRQITALERVTRQLTTKATSGDMTKADIDSLSTCIEITIKLKAKEKDLLDNLSDEELAAILK